MKLSPTQLRVLRYASEGRLIRHWSSAPGSQFRFYVRDAEGRQPSGTTVYKLLSLGLVDWKNEARSKVVVTPAGRALLEEASA